MDSTQKSLPKFLGQPIELNKINVMIGPGNLNTVYTSNNFDSFNVQEYYLPESEFSPEKQRDFINNIIGLVNHNFYDSVIFYTNSPYIINWLGCLVKAGNLYDKYENIIFENKISDIIEKKYSIRNKSLSVFELSKDLTITKYENENGIPPDEDYLNEQLAYTNDLFSDLLDVQQEIEIENEKV